MIQRLGDCVGRVAISSGMFPESVQGDWLRKSLLRLLRHLEMVLEGLKHPRNVCCKFEDVS